MTMHKRGVRRLVFAAYSAEPTVHALRMPYQSQRAEKRKQATEPQMQSELQVWEGEGGNPVSVSPPRASFSTQGSRTGRRPPASSAQPRGGSNE
jgi:hypothetical protein